MVGADMAPGPRQSPPNRTVPVGCAVTSDPVQRWKQKEECQVTEYWQNIRPNLDVSK